MDHVEFFSAWHNKNWGIKDLQAGNPWCWETNFSWNEWVLIELLPYYFAIYNNFEKAWLYSNSMLVIKIAIVSVLQSMKFNFLWYSSLSLAPHCVFLHSIAIKTQKISIKKKSEKRIVLISMNITNFKVEFYVTSNAVLESGILALEGLHWGRLVR